jgi:Protein of unknown function (DUF2934)
MGKPTTTSTKKITAKRVVKPASTKNGEAQESTVAAIPNPPATKAKRVRKPTPAAEKPAAVTTRRTTTATKSSRKSQSVATKPAYTSEDIALRAYFIAEKRRQLGIYGSPESDWLEAERQLRETLKK